jgi:hypothetical protein
MRHVQSTSLLCVVAVASINGGCNPSAGHEDRGAGTPVASGAAVLEADLDLLVGPSWKGTLTYLDYTSKKLTTIPSTLLVTRKTTAAGAEPTWRVAFGYTDEPHADKAEDLPLRSGGKLLGDEPVMERSVLADGTVRLVTEMAGQDDSVPAQLRRVYLITRGRYEIQKWVRPAGAPEYFQRYVYRWTR